MPKYYLKMTIFAPVTTIFVLNHGALCGQTVVSLSAMLMVDAGKDLSSFGLCAVGSALAPSFKALRLARFSFQQVRPRPFRVKLVVSLNIQSHRFNTIFSYRKRKKSHAAKSGE